MVAATHLYMQMRNVLDDAASVEQYNILRILRGALPEGHSCGNISSRMIDNSPDITRRLDGLVDRGLVVREKSKDDRRVVVCKITKKGLNLLDQLEPKIAAFEKRMMENLSEAECKELVAFCEKIL